MPELVRLYIRQTVIGLGLSVLFVALLLAGNVANLAHLVVASPSGWLAVLMLVIFNAIVFAGAQFGIAVMRMGGSDDSRGGRAYLAIPVPVRTAERPAPPAPPLTTIFRS